MSADAAHGLRPLIVFNRTLFDLFATGYFHSEFRCASGSVRRP
ncbi:hypothetical protein [Streptomyces yangpuensis]